MFLRAMILLGVFVAMSQPASARIVRVIGDAEVTEPFYWESQWKQDFKERVITAADEAARKDCEENKKGIYDPSFFSSKNKHGTCEEQKTCIEWNTWSYSHPYCMARPLTCKARVSADCEVAD